MRTGMDIITPAADATPQEMALGLTVIDATTGSVLAAEDVKRLEKRYSFQANIETITIVAANPGSIIGVVT
jgi:hypothetical protein